MNVLLSFEGKLVRDNIPDLMITDGQHPVVRTIEGEELLDATELKIREEVKELINAEPDGKVEELADVLEIIKFYQQQLCITDEQLKLAQDQKRILKGGFQKALFLKRSEEQ
jgi:predicted house-cleaning noncanonical NTP pyrophosphatase (MazG superfamily)